MSSDVSSDEVVIALCTYNGALYAGGIFNTAGGVDAKNIAKWDGLRWSAVGSGLNDWCYSLAVYNGALYAGGKFTTAGGVDAKRIAKWDGLRWSAVETIAEIGPRRPAVGRPTTGVASVASALGALTWAVRFDELALGDVLGTGSFAKVYVARWHGTEVAVKLFHLANADVADTQIFSSMLLPKIKAEADLLASIRHPHIVGFIGMCMEPPCVVIEHCSRGSLYKLLERAKSDPALAAELTWSRRLRMVVDAAAGMGHLHARSPAILHRDLKSPNLLVDSSWRVKVSDLGLSRLVEEAATATTIGSTAASMNPRWVAPEVLEGNDWVLASDVYAFGVVLWELLTWELPWAHIRNTVAIPIAVVRGESLPIPDVNELPGPRPKDVDVLDGYKRLVARCTTRDPSARPPFPMVLSELNELYFAETSLQDEAVEATEQRHEESVITSSRQSSLMSEASNLCVICMENPSTTGLVHGEAKEYDHFVFNLSIQLIGNN